MVKKKMRERLIALSLLGAMLPFTAIATGEEEPVESFELGDITVEAKRPDWESKLSPGTVTIIRPDDYKGEQKNLPDLLKNVPGVHVREVNGKGQYTTVTVRGSTAAQVGIFVDGVLTNLGGDAAVDISTIPVKNVERIEVYRGYIPSRFGGTYMGGVVNIVTKKPQRHNVAAELGKRSLGGWTGSVQVDSPLGDGSVMFGVNHEQSDGDFKYENYAAGVHYEMVHKARIEREKDYNEFMDGYPVKQQKENIKKVYERGGLSEDTRDYYLAHPDQWDAYVTGAKPGKSLNEDWMNKAYNDVIHGPVSVPFFKVWLRKNRPAEYKEIVEFNSPESWLEENEEPGAVYDENYHPKTAEQQLIYDFMRDHAQEEKNKVNGKWVYYQDKGIHDRKKELEDYYLDMKENEGYHKDPNRVRRYNDFKNTDAILKWQDGKWTVKGTWKKVDRHLPDSVWSGNIAQADMPGPYIDKKDEFYAEGRHQKIDAKEIMVGRRSQKDKLEWGWKIDYLDQNKKYNVEKPVDYGTSAYWNTSFMRLWSRFDSDKVSAQVDGTYNLADNHLLEFMASFSREVMKINGDKLDQYDYMANQPEHYQRFRNYYRQEQLHAQVQDTITLDKEGTFFLTANLRYNQSKNLGRSRRVIERKTHKWVNYQDEQTNGKLTWQLALKKEFNDNWAVRLTGGTYYRLLNLYEIAGDGAGILPPPRTKKGMRSAFPLPEDGKQIDLSAIYRGKWLKADTNTTLTFFWRKADNMLQLTRRGLDYWSYFNDNRGRILGAEVEHNMRWKKAEANFTLTFTHMNMEQRNTAYEDFDGYLPGVTVSIPWYPVWATYQPKWEGSLRLMAYPNPKWTLFTEFHYRGQMYTRPLKTVKPGYDPKLSGCPVQSLFTVGAGFKWKPAEDWQVTVGCNDIFNQGPKGKVWFYDYYINDEYPIQGRTYYMTVRHQF